jgi:2',3'-cyclic-nucleotide 2'-phosphodiesterase (5'-nucleotidase family)/precorrin-6B methylase 2
MHRTLLVPAVAGLLLGAACATPHPPAATDRTAVLVAINDVYRIEGVENGNVGGLARVRALRAELAKDHPDLVMLHAGDFLFPSFASRMLEGEQMIAVLNGLDGDPAAFDERMFATFGNHEFDKGKLKHAPMLDRRIEESQFRWLNGNIRFAKGVDGKPLIDAPNLETGRIVESGGIRLGIFGVTIPSLGIEYVEDFDGPQATVRRLTADLRSRGAEVVIAVTHLDADDDRAILEKIPVPEGPDLIIGGHDHEHMAVQAGGRWLLKADADARTATIARLTLDAAGRLKIEHEFRRLAGDAPRPDPALQGVVDAWQAKHEALFCTQQKAAPGCLKEVYGQAQVPLVAEENKIRGQETNLGDWIADRMVATFAACGAQAAFINAGSLRLNQDLPPGPMTRRQIEELFAYETPLYLLEIDGATLKKVAEQAVRAWPGSGRWLQISGFAWVHDQGGRSARQVTLLAHEGARLIADDETVRVVTGDYLINPDIGDQDGYPFLGRDQVVADCAANGKDLKKIVVEALAAAGSQGIAPQAQGRICQPGADGAAGGPCLAAAQRTPAGVFGHEHWQWLEREGRDELEKPDVVLAAMNLHDGDVVAEIGAGTGFYTRRLARAVGPSGTVYANDIQPEMLDKLKELAAAEKLTNIVTVTGTETDPKLPDGLADWILLVDVYHEFQQPQEMLAKIKQALKPNGRVALVEYRLEGETASHISVAHRMSESQVLAEWQPAGFTLMETIETLPSQRLFLFTLRRGVHAR